VAAAFQGFPSPEKTNQQELLRHSTIQTTMNVYTQAMSEGKRAANSVIVRSVLPFETCGGVHCRTAA
jgi:integrase